jgi:predicted N-acetyltransferase YhbS
MQRADRIEIRSATPGELEQVAALLTERGEPADAVDLRLVAADPEEGVDSVFVAVDDGRVVATATLLHETVRVGDVSLPAAQVELVATAASHEGRGLVRALMELAHVTSDHRGDVVQVMVGIPYFYRQFGYSYSMPIPGARRLVTVPDADPAIRVRIADAADVAVMDALQLEEQASAQVAMTHSASCWRWLVARDGSQQWIAERGGVAIATGRATPPDEGMVLGELAGRPEGIDALIAHAHRMGGEATSVMDRHTANAHAVIEPRVEPTDDHDGGGEWFYVRVSRLAPLLNRLRPVLAARWRAAGGEECDVMVSSYRSHVRFHLGPDGMSEVVAGGHLQAPVSAGGSGVPPDVLGPLVFGPFGAAGLEPHHPDMWLGRQRELMHALFPPVRSDVLTFYLPV